MSIDHQQHFITKYFICESILTAISKRKTQFLFYVNTRLNPLSVLILLPLATIVVLVGSGNTHRIHHSIIINHWLAIQNHNNWLALDRKMHHHWSTIQTTHRTTIAEDEMSCHFFFALFWLLRMCGCAFCIWNKSKTQTYTYDYYSIFLPLLLFVILVSIYMIPKSFCAQQLVFFVVVLILSYKSATKMSLFLISRIKMNWKPGHTFSKMNVQYSIVTHIHINEIINDIY